MHVSDLSNPTAGAARGRTPRPVDTRPPDSESVRDIVDQQRASRWDLNILVPTALVGIGPDLPTPVVDATQPAAGVTVHPGPGVARGVEGRWVPGAGWVVGDPGDSGHVQGLI